MHLVSFILHTISSFFLYLLKQGGKEVINRLLWLLLVAHTKQLPVHMYLITLQTLNIHFDKYVYLNKYIN